VNGLNAEICGAVRVVMDCLVSKTGLAYTNTALTAKATANWRAGNMVESETGRAEGGIAIKPTVVHLLFKVSNKQQTCLAGTGKVCTCLMPNEGCSLWSNRSGQDTNNIYRMTYDIQGLSNMLPSRLGRHDDCRLFNFNIASEEG
jgi:hypothetical protein